MQSIRTQSQFSGRTQTSSESLTKILRTLFADCPSFRDDRITPAKTKQQATNCLNKSFLDDMNADPFAGIFRHLLLADIFSHHHKCWAWSFQPRHVFFICLSVCMWRLLFLDPSKSPPFPDSIYKFKSLVIFCHKKVTICFRLKSPIGSSPIRDSAVETVVWIYKGELPWERGRKENACDM